MTEAAAKVLFIGDWLEITGIVGVGGIGGTAGWWLGGLCAVASLIWILQCGAVWLRDTRESDIGRLPSDEPSSGWPTVAVVFAARDEAEHVEAAARSLLALDYPRLEIIVVNDRSTDGTGAILDRVAREDPRLAVVHIDSLPDGWLGKTYALQRAFDMTEADWILFTDGDVVLAPDVVKRTVSLAARRDFDQLAAAPCVTSETIGERVFLSTFISAFLVIAHPALIEARWCKAAMGVGAFNLFRAAFLRRIGGLQRIRLSVDDDMRLGQAVKFNGGKCRMLNGRSTVSVRWHVGMWGMVRGLEKNFFAAQEFKARQLPIGTFGIAWTMAGPHLGLLADNPLRWVNLLGVLAICGALARVGANSRVGWQYGFITPLGGLAMIFAMWRSALLTWKRGGVVWRNHLYPLADLKAHIAERNRWLDDCWRRTRTVK